MSIVPRLAVILLALAVAVPAVAGVTEDERARNAVRVLNEIQAIPESGIPDVMLDQAKAIVVVPDTLKIGLVLGGRRGHGLVSIKTPQGTWSNPSFVKLTGASIGFQAGVQSSDVVLVFTSQRGLDSIVNGKLTLGADASVAAGPVGRTTGLATDGGLKAEIWSWSRARGLFAGVALDGAVLSIDDAANQNVYGGGTTPRMIFEDRAGQRASDAVVGFRDQLEEATATARAARQHEPARAPAAGANAPAPAPLPPGPQYNAPLNAPLDAPTQPQPFEPVDSPQPPAIHTEPLPPNG
ncbi:lipid-binding SYLF domain-containing protein [Novilysobacter antarcticus]|uniref:lipid-binding SYLF domain-containing protein n=1 Tax=Novilysobacter antarcticus TaxID=2862543 RepID=UPI001C999687|nr:lipid-binding SYLF domain-containing protein [Lysobacter antarcticus]